MKWHYKILGGHAHVRVFMNGAMCGTLCFRVDEFERFKDHQTKWPSIIEFVDEKNVGVEHNAQIEGGFNRPSGFRFYRLSDAIDKAKEIGHKYVFSFDDSKRTIYYPSNRETGETQHWIAT